MPTYLYCLASVASATESPPVAAPGIGGAAVRVLAAGGLEAWVSTIATSSPPATVAAALEHDAVVSAALATGRTPLPARFGQSWPSDAACVASVTQRAAELEPLVRRVAGLVEMTVCAGLPVVSPATEQALADPDEAAPGSAYLRRLRAHADRDRHARAALEALRGRASRALAPLSRGEVAEIRRNGEWLALSISYLVERGGEAQFRRAVDELAREAATRLVIAGPRAPYSFALAPHQQHGADAAQPANHR
jgi:hypothetical protein